MKLHFYLLAALLEVGAQAGPRSSASYTVPADSTEPAGRRTTSARYTVDASVGGIASISTVDAPAETLKAGYVGQLYEVTGLAVTSAAPSVNENATLQLGAWQLLDDGSYLGVGANTVGWSVPSGPLSGISAGGLVTAASVYQNAATTVQGSYSGFAGTLNLTVLNVDTDDFGPYAADGLPDDWQVQYFGMNNPLAAPGLDANGNGFTNLFKFLAGLNPLNANERFTLGSLPPSGQAAPRTIQFAPVVADRSYVVESTPSLVAPNWQPLTNFTESNNGTTRTVTDNAASGATKFYRVRIVKP